MLRGIYRQGVTLVRAQRDDPRARAGYACAGDQHPAGGWAAPADQGKGAGGCQNPLFADLTVFRMVI